MSNRMNNVSKKQLRFLIKSLAYDRIKEEHPLWGDIRLEGIETVLQGYLVQVIAPKEKLVFVPRQRVWQEIYWRGQ